MVGSQHSLLLIEDSLDDETLSLRAISASGVPCEVLVMRHGGEAIALLLSPEGPAPDLIILDFDLPGYSGIEILREIRAQPKLRQVPVVMLSSHDCQKDVADCLRERANSFVQKPIDPAVYSEHVGLIVRYWLTVHRPREEASRIGEPAQLPPVPLPK